MAKERKSTEGSIPLLLLGDVFGYGITAGPFLAALLANAYFALNCLNHGLSALLIFLFFSPLSFFAVFVVTVFLIRICLPKLKPGTYPANFNLGMIAWILHLALSRSGVLFGMREFILAFNATKYLFWRALGGKIDFRTAASLTVSLTEVPLITIDRGCTLADNIFILCHNFTGNELTLSPVHIGERVFIANKCIIWPNTKIGNDSWIGMECNIGPNANLGNSVNVGIGSRVFGTVVTDGEKIANFSTITHKV